MKKLLCAILALCLLIPATGMAAKEVVNVFNWEDYIDRSVRPIPARSMWFFPLNTAWSA